MFIEVARDKNGFSARVKLVDAHSVVRGTREMTGASCPNMIDTMALSISIAIDPDSLTRPAGTPPPPQTSEEAREPAATPDESPVASSPRDAAAGPAQTKPSATNGPRVELFGAPTVWLGMGPPLVVGGEAGARLRWPSLSFGLALRGDLPASRTLGNVDVSIGFIAGVADACVHYAWVAACATGTVGVVSASSNATQARDDHATRALVGANLRGELPLTDRIHPFAQLMTNLALGRHTVAEGGSDVYELPSLSGGAALGVSVGF
jgi:hypothetical protein